MRAPPPLEVSSASSSSPFLFSQPQIPPRLRYAVLGAGFAGLSVAYNLLKLSPKDSNLRIDVFDEVGIGGGASGVSGGLLHPYSPKAKLLWRAAECWDEALRLLNVAEAAVPDAAPIVRRRLVLSTLYVARIGYEYPNPDTYPSGRYPNSFFFKGKIIYVG